MSRNRAKIGCPEFQKQIGINRRGFLKTKDVLATIYEHLGIDTRKHYLDHSGRPVITLPFGKPLTELF